MLKVATTFTHLDYFIEDSLKHCLHNDLCLREGFEEILGVAQDIFIPLSFQGFLMTTVTTSSNRIDDFLDVILKFYCDDNCHWVDTGQEQNLCGFLASDRKLINSRNLAKIFLSNTLDVVEQNWISELLRLLSVGMDVHTMIKLCLLRMLSFPLSGIVPTMFPVIAMAIGIQVPQTQWLKLTGSRSATINQVFAHVAQATWETLSDFSTSIPLIVVAPNPVIKMLTAIIQGCDSLHCALIVFVYEDSLLVGLLLNHDLIHFPSFLGEICWYVPELHWDDKVQLRSYSLTDFSLYLNFLFLPFDPGIHNIPVTNDFHMTVYTNISVLPACDLIATLGCGQVCGPVMEGVCTKASEYGGKTAKSSGVLFFLCQCYIVKQCIATFFEIFKRVGYKFLFKSVTKNIQLDIHFPAIGLAISPEVHSHSEMDLIAKLGVGRAHVFSLSVSLAYLTVYVVPHVLIYAYVPVLAFMTETKYSSPEITGMQEYLKDPRKFTATAVTSVDAAVYELYDGQIRHNPLETTGVGIVHCCAKQLGPYTDAEEKAKQGLMIGCREVLTHHAPCHVYQYECHFKEALQFMENYSRTWNPLPRFIYTHNWWYITCSYLDKTWVQLTCLFTDAFLSFSCKLVEKLTIPWSAFWIAELLQALMSSIHNALEELDPTVNKSKLHKVFKVGSLILPSSSPKKFFDIGRGCILWFEKLKEGSILEVPLDNEASVEFLWVVNSSKEEQDNTVISVQLYLNLEDKVLIKGGRIVMNVTKMEDPFRKLSNYVWDPGKMPIYRGVKLSISTYAIMLSFIFLS